MSPTRKIRLVRLKLSGVCDHAEHREQEFPA